MQRNYKAAGGHWTACVGVVAMSLGLVLQSSAVLAGAPKDELQSAGPVFGDASSKLLGIYEPLSPGERIAGVTEPVTTNLSELSLMPAAKLKASITPAIDPKGACQVLGPFRMMAQPDVKFEILRDAPNKLVFLFEKSSWGHVRTIGVDAQHIDFTNVRPMWNGDSIAVWEGSMLSIDTVHFTDKTWLNEAGVTNSKQLRLTERLRPIGDRYLEYTATAVDPEVLVGQVTYTRYFKRTNREIIDDNCFSHKSPVAGQDR